MTVGVSGRHGRESCVEGSVDDCLRSVVGGGQAEQGVVEDGVDDCLR
jgi:hypothetical protein